MYINEIKAEAAALSGAEEGALEICAAAAEAGLLRKLREGVDPESIRDVFIAAASLMALSIYFAADGGVSFKAGEVSLSGRKDNTAETMAAQAEALLAGFIRDESFGFMGVDG